MYVTVSTDMGQMEIPIASFEGDPEQILRKQCVEICNVGFWYHDTFYPASRVNYAEIVRDE